MSGGRSRIENLQILRAFAALSVVFFHLGDLLANLGFPPFKAVGIDLFFVISGFVMVHSTIASKPSPGEFILNRLTRIVPVYWLMTIFAFAIVVIAPSLLKATSMRFDELLQSLFFIPFRKSNGVIQPTLFVGWTLNYEMFFYLLFALGLFFRNYFLGLAAVFSTLVALSIVGTIFQPEQAAAAFYCQPVVLEFGLGMAIACMPGWERLLSSAVLALLLIVAAAAMVILPNFYPAVPSLWTAGVPAAILIGTAVSLERAGCVFHARLPLLLGEASYILYLSHVFICIPIDKLAPRLVSHGVLSAAAVVVGLVLASAAGIFLHLTLEVPLTVAVRRWLSFRFVQARKASTLN